MALIPVTVRFDRYHATLPPLGMDQGPARSWSALIECAELLEGNTSRPYHLSERPIRSRSLGIKLNCNNPSDGCDESAVR